MDRRRAAGAVLLVAALALSGCVGSAEELVAWTHPERGGDGPPSPRVDWSPGNWWSYATTFVESNRTYDIALVVYEESPTSFTVGTNLSAGFFGLPFNGNVTKQHLNPIIGGEEWRLFDFPLEGGKTWSYEFMGYPVKAKAEETRIEVPGIPAHRGYTLTASSYGRTVVEYTYSPVTKWFTGLVLYEPSDGTPLVRVALTGFGERYDEEYYVNVPLWEYDADYPLDPPGEREFSVEREYLRLTGLVALKGTLGDFHVALRNPSGHVAMEGAVRGQGVLLDRETLDPAKGTWRIDHRGLGEGSLHVEVSGLTATRAGQPVPPGEAAPPETVGESFDLARLLAGAAPAAPEGAPAAAPSVVSLPVG